MIAGIDGGGTSTRIEIRDDENRCLGREVFGPFNISGIGETAFRNLLRQMIRKVPFGKIDRLVIGGAGVSYVGLKEIVHEELQKGGFVGQLLLCPDFEIALRGAMDGAGCVIIGGTGAVGFGKNEKGETARAGGYGHVIDDGGSGYAIGRDAFAMAVRTEDGRAQAFMLRDALYRTYHLHCADDVLDLVYYRGRDKAGIADAARQVFLCAVAGDEVSLKILHRNALQLKEIVQALSVRLGIISPRTALLGGLLANDTVYRKIVLDALQKAADIVTPAHDALWGAAQMAFEMPLTGSMKTGMINEKQEGRKEQK